MNRLQFLKRSVLAVIGVAAGVKAIAEIKSAAPLHKLPASFDLYKDAIQIDEWKWEAAKPIVEFPFYQQDVVSHVEDDGSLSSIKYLVAHVDYENKFYGLNLINPEKAHPLALKVFSMDFETAHQLMRKNFSVSYEDKPGIGGEEFKITLDKKWFS